MMLGRIFDITGSYSSAFEICFVLCILGGAATLSCLPFESEQARSRAGLAPSAGLRWE
jgi:hypothetical protein